MQLQSELQNNMNIHGQKKGKKILLKISIYHDMVFEHFGWYEHLWLEPMPRYMPQNMI
jgi:hypothetical protein